MRTVFFEQLKNKMREDESIFLLIADMGLGLVEPIQKEFPDRFINIGIAEQNMIGVSAGLCNVGFRPFCYTISNFLTQRCFEQIRNDICLHEYPITLVGTSTGFDNGLLGPTHQVIDDIGCVKSLPKMNIYSPSTVDSIKMIFEDVIKNKQPAYIRIGKSSYNLETPADNMNYMAKNSNNSEILVITHGTMLENCLKATDENNDFSVYVMNKIKPLSGAKLRELFEKYSKIVVVEDHMISSGLYNSLCQHFVEMQIKESKLYGLGVPDVFEKRVGNKDYFADRYGYSPEKISNFIFKLK